MQSPRDMNARSPELASLVAFAERVTTVLDKDDRVRVAWLTGSLATGTADAYSDLDLRVAVLSEDFARIGEWWNELIDNISPCRGYFAHPKHEPNAIQEAIRHASDVELT